MFFEKLRVLIFAHQNTVRSMFLEFLQIVEGGGPRINIFLMVYFDVFRQSSRLNFRTSKQSSLYLLGVFVDSRGRGAPDKRIPEMTLFEKVPVLIFAHQNTVHSMFMEFLQIVEGGGPLMNVFLRVYFYVFRQSLCFNFRTSKQISFYVF